MVKSALEAVWRRRWGAEGRPNVDVHAEEAGYAREDRAQRKADGGRRDGEHRYDRGDDHADDGDRPVLAAVIGLSAFLNGAGDFLHLFIAGRSGKNRTAGEKAVKHGNHTT